jgi:hypothetical protein
MNDSCFISEDLVLYLHRLEETDIIKALRKDNNDYRADIICQRVRMSVGEYVVDEGYEGYREPGRDHQIFADVITAVGQLKAICGL